MLKEAAGIKKVVLRLGKTDLRRGLTDWCQSSVFQGTWIRWRPGLCISFADPGLIGSRESGQMLRIRKT